MKYDETEYGTFENFVWAFKKMLVCRYNLGVDDVAQFDVTQIEPYYNEGKDIYEAYFEFFNVEPNIATNDEYAELLTTLEEDLAKVV